ncbi:MAG: glycosyltransferase, partial [Clostridiales bacterium]|nr:glycosyltransferase [Clostridiales bacterium]
MIDSQEDLISVIVPIFKVEKDLPSCVKSIQAQTYTNLEIFLVDDGSPDNCPQICDALRESDSRIQVIHKANGGLSDARNVALDKCTGKYVIFVDSDDLVHPEMIKILHLLCVENKTEIAVCNYLSVATRDFQYNALVNAHTRSSEIEILSPEAALIYMMDVYKNFQVAAWNKMYERKLFDHVRYPVGIYYEDIATTYKLIGQCNSVAYTHEQLYFYQLRDSSITRSGYNSRDLDKVKNSGELLSYVEINYPSIK